MIGQTLERLAALGFQLLPATELGRHFVIGRGGFVALVERTPEGFGRAGAPGLLTEAGPGFLVWRGESAFFVAKGYERPAAEEEIRELRRFAQDLNEIFQPPAGAG